MAEQSKSLVTDYFCPMHGLNGSRWDNPTPGVICKCPLEKKLEIAEKLKQKALNEKKC